MARNLRPMPVARFLIVLTCAPVTTLIVAIALRTLITPIINRATLVATVKETSIALQRSAERKSKIYKSDCYRREEPLLTSCDTIRVTYAMNGQDGSVVYQRLHKLLLGTEPQEECQPGSFVCTLSGIQRRNRLLTVEVFGSTSDGHLEIAVQEFPFP